MMRRLLLVAVLAMLAWPSAARAQSQPAPLDAFVAQVARHWASGDANALAALAPADGRIVLDVGADGPGAVQARHVAAALRSLFGGRETVNVRPTQVTISGGNPVRGFGELSWNSRVRGVSDPQSSIVYLGVVWEGRAWKIHEIRVLR